MRKVFAAMLMVAGLSAGEPWSKSDIAWEVVYQALLVADWNQTRQIAGESPTISLGTEPRFHEKNPVLGRYPSKRRVDVYFAASSIFHILLIDWLPAKYRRVFQVVGIGVSINTVTRNYNVGVSVKF